MRYIKILTLAFAFVILLLNLSCTHFRVDIDPKTTNWSIETTGAPLLNRSDKFTITHMWLDEKNVLHEIRIERNTDENASSQVEMIKLIEKLTTGAVTTAK